MRLEDVLSWIAREFSGVRAKDAVADIARHHRIQASPGYDDAVGVLEEQLRKRGIASKRTLFPADGVTDTFGWVSPPGWEIRGGELEQTFPHQERLASFEIIKQSILGQSAPGEAEGDLVHVGKGDTEACFEGLDLEGKFVLTSGRPAAMLRLLKGRGVAGLIIYPDVERAAPSHDLVQYGGFFPRKDELSWLPMGFSVSRRTADALLQKMATDGVRVRGRVDAAFIENPMIVLEATIPGSLPGDEILLCAHLCHPAQSANDNASGSGVLLEVARVLAGLAERGALVNPVRLIWVPEFNGTIPWAAANAAALGDVLFSINLDMVGQSPEIIGEPLRAFRIPNSHPVFVNACIEPLFRAIAEGGEFRAAHGSNRVLHWVLDAPTGGSDHLVFQAPPADIPSLMLGHDDPYWHTDLDTMEKVDPTRLKHVGVMTAALATLPGWGREERDRLAGWLLAFGQRELVRAAELAERTDTNGQDLLSVALQVEMERIASLRRFLGESGWEDAPYVTALKAAHAALLPRAAEARAATMEAGDDRAPARVLHGPVRYELVADLPEEDRDFLETKLVSHYGASPQSLVNLANGSRTLSEIAARLSLDFGRVFSVADVARAAELLARMGYLTMAESR